MSDNQPGARRGSIQGCCLPLIWVLAVDAQYDFVLMLPVNFQRDDGSPGLLWAQHANVLRPED